MLLFWWGSRYSGSRQLAIFHIGFGYGYDPRRFATAAGCGQPWQLQQGGRHSRLVTTMVSQRIAVLEQELGQSLFRRHRRGHPTPACEQFLPAATAALKRTGRGRLAMQGAPALPRIRLSCVSSLTTAVFGPCCWPWWTRPSDRCNTDHSGIIMQELLTGETDVGFILKCPAIAGIQLELALPFPDHRRGLRRPPAGRAARADPAGHCQRAAGAPAVGDGLRRADPAVASAAPGGEPAARHPASECGAGAGAGARLHHPDAGARHHPGSGVRSPG